MSLLHKLQARIGADRSEDDDDLDSDYHPGKDSDEEAFTKVQRKVTNVKNRKRKHLKTSTTKLNKRQNLRSAKQNPDEGSKNTFEGFQSSLPDEILIKIFQFGIAGEGFTKFIPRVAQVCKHWNQIASDPTLAHRLDLGSGHGMLSRKNQSLLTNLLKRDVSLCQELDLHGQGNLGSSAFETILNQVPRLRTLDLCGCIVKQALVKSLPQLCPLIRSLNLSSLPGNNYTQRNFNAASVFPSIQLLGPNLIELRLSNLLAVAQQGTAFLEVIQENCPKLEELDLGISGISHCGSLMVDMAALARGCPRLRELFLDGFIVSSSSMVHNPNASSFRNLQVYSQTNNRQRDVDVPVFFSLFSSVKRLKVLNISYSRLLPSHFTHWLKDVEEAYLQGMSLSDNDQHEIVECVAAWSSSLRTLDLSHSKPCNGVIHKSLSRFERAGEYPLEVLNLSNTNVTPCSIIHVINACKNLKEINLNSCRELPRGSKREFKKEEFPFLKQLLERSDVEDGGETWQAGVMTVSI